MPPRERYSKQPSGLLQRAACGSRKRGGASLRGRGSPVYQFVGFLGYRLFLSEEDLHRTSKEVELGAELVLKESSVRLADILRKIAEERE